MPTNEDSAAFRHWRDLVGFSRGEQAARSGVDYLLGQIAEGWVFRPGETDLVAEMVDYAPLGLATGLRRLWPQLQRLVAGNALMARRMAELSERALIVEVDLDGFAAGTRHFDDGSYLLQFDNGLLLTVFEVVQLLVQMSMPHPGGPNGRERAEAAVVLELVRAEYRLLRRHATPKGTLPTPRQGEAIGELSLAANAFVLAHELSHLLLGHSGAGDPERRQQEEIESDVLAIQILAGAYAVDPRIQRAQAYGRLLGARLAFACIELVEHAVYVTSSRTHPPAADRWEIVRLTAEKVFGATVPEGVDQVWRPMERLLAAKELSLGEVSRTLESMVARRRFIGEAADVPLAVNLIRRFRLTEVADVGPQLRADAAALAATAKAESTGRAAISWTDLLRLQLGRRAQGIDESVMVVAGAARILLDEHQDQARSEAGGGPLE